MVEPLLAGDMERQYLILPRTEEETAGYEQKMVMRNKIDGLLSVEMRTIDQEEQYYYDVTGKKPLEEFLNQKKLTAENIAFIYGSIIDKIMNAKQYLLQEDNFVVAKDTVYLDSKEEKLYLCYKEDFHVEIQKQLTELTEYFMNQIDYHDEKAVLYIYGIYKLIRQENCTFTDINGILDKYSQSKMGRQEKEEEPLKETQFSFLKPEQDYELESDSELRQQKIPVKFSMENILFVAVNMAIIVFLYKTGWFHQKITGQPDLKKCVLTGIVLLAGDSFVLKKIKKEQTDATFILDDEGEEDDGSTVLLCNGQAQYELISEEGVRCIEFSQQELPIMVGKSRECGKGYLPHKIISRRHAKFRWNAGRFQITDAGSTNGTFLNGEELKSGQFYDVQNEDKIIFGNMAFTIQIKGV